MEEYRTLKLNLLATQYTNDCNTERQRIQRQITRIRQTRPINMSILISSLLMSLNRYLAARLEKYNRDAQTIKDKVPPTIAITGAKRALLVGINYANTSNELYGCINDVTAIKERLVSKGFATNQITTLTDFTEMKPTRASILNEFKKMLVQSNSGDLLVFAYSGHGSYVRDMNGDETDGNDEVICPIDNAIIKDDELKKLIQLYLKKNVTLFALFDCCFSGTILDLRYQYMDSLQYDKFTENSRQLETVGNVILISGCTDRQTSADAFIDRRSSGAMTWSLLDTLNKSQSTISWTTLVQTMRARLKESQFEQIPQLSSGMLLDEDASIFI